MDKLEYRDRHEALRQSEPLLSFEFVMQFFLVAFCATLGWVETGIDIIAIWFCAYYTLVFIEKFALHLTRGSNSRWVYFALLAHNFLIGCTFSALPVFLWYHEPDIFKFAAMAILVGATMNTLLIRSKSWEVMLCFLIPNTLAIFAIAMCFVLEINCTGSGAIATVIALSIFFYMLFSMRAAYLNNRKHQKAQSYLLQAQKMEAVGNFSSGIAHDFNNLLNVISGNLEILSDSRNRFPPEELIHAAQTAVARGSQLTKSLLAFGRVSKNEQKLEAVNPILDEVSLMLSRLLPSSISIEVSTEDNLPEIDVDQNALQSALLNLAINASDAMTGTGHLTIRTSVAHKKDIVGGASSGRNNVRYCVVIEITDTGHGIPQEIIGRVTDLFFTTKEVGKGTGLGLAMVAEFAAKSGGWIDLSNHKSGGAIATLCLPLPVSWKPPLQKQNLSPRGQNSNTWSGQT